MKNTTIKIKHLAKGVAAATIISILATPVMANDWEKKMNIGISGNKLEHNSNQDYNWGAQAEFNTARSFKSVPGLRLGWNLAFEYYTLGEVESLNDDAGMNVDGMIIAGYTFADKFDVPVEFMGGVGYAVGQIGKDYNSGLAYKGAVMYNFTPGFGMGVQYKHVDLSVVTLVGEFDSGLDIASAFISISI